MPMNLKILSSIALRRSGLYLHTNHQGSCFNFCTFFPIAKNMKHGLKELSVSEFFIQWKVFFLFFLLYCQPSAHSFRRFISPNTMLTNRIAFALKEQNSDNMGRNSQSVLPKTLDEKTKWKISINFQQNNTVISKAMLNVRFIEYKNYEPPQGRVYIEDDFNGLVKTDERGYAGIWSLSEDKDDRKDGLWIWGLFEEPKYPFLYFYLGSLLIDLIAVNFKWIL